jgi:hypothetical protein
MVANYSRADEDGGMRPVLLIDVDGPLNPFHARWFAGHRPADGYGFHRLTPSDGYTYWVALNPEHGRRLLELTDAYDLAWATTWQHDANRLIAPLIGLPGDLPVVPLHRPRGLPVHRCWKTDQVAEWVGSRSFAWIDDEINQATRDWLEAREGLGPHLARRVSAETGLTQGDFDALKAFADAL